MNIVAIAGGVGGAKMAHGLVQAFPGARLSIVVNIGDDFEHFGLKICPDLDTVCYTLAGLANPQTGWGRADETWEAFQAASQLGGPDWFHLGDRDLGVHLERTRRLRAGQSLSQITHHFCEAWGIEAKVLPATDDPVPTWVETVEGSLPFQEYFVRRRCEPVVRSPSLHSGQAPSLHSGQAPSLHSEPVLSEAKEQAFTFRGIEHARPAPGVLEGIDQADAIVICPSNPWVSVDPVLSIPGIRSSLVERRQAGCPLAAISPIIGGKTIKGPAAKMFTELGIPPSAFAVASHYQDLASDFILDVVDAEQAEAIARLGIRPWMTDTVMNRVEDRRRLAQEIIGWLQIEKGEMQA